MNDLMPNIVVRSRNATPTELRWEQKAEDLEFETLSRVRSSAEKWATSLGAMLALSGTILIVKGRDDVSKLDDGFRIAVGISLLMAVILGIWATYLAAKAAQGTPRNVRWPTGSKLQKWEHDEALSSRGQLTRSRQIAIVTVAFVLIAIGVTWFGSAKSAGADSVLVVPRKGAPVCGTLSSNKGGDSVVLSYGLKKTFALDGSQMEDVIQVESCP
jgi:hypothetical protein